MNDCKRYEGITPEKMAQLKQRMLNSGIRPPDGDYGLIESMGVKVSLCYVPAEQVLDVCIVDKPDFIPSALVWGQIEAPFKM